jgi:hypothetical protein
VLSVFIQAISSVSVHSSEFVPIANVIFSASCSLELVSKKMLIVLIHLSVSISRLAPTSTSRITRETFPETQYSALSLCSEPSRSQVGPRYTGCTSLKDAIACSSSLVQYMQQVLFSPQFITVPTGSVLSSGLPLALAILGPCRDGCRFLHLFCREQYCEPLYF